MTLLQKLWLFIKPRTVFKSDDGHIVIQDKIEDGRPVRLLLYDDIRESGIYLDDGMRRDPLFYYMRSLKEISLFYEGIKNVLLIGGGGMSFPKYFLEAVPDGMITVIEKNAQMIELARQFFFFENDDRVLLHIGDGASYISKRAVEGSMSTEYDAVVFDAFVGNRPPKEFSSEGIYKLTKQIMSKEGILAINMLNEKPGVISMQTHLAQAILKTIFRHTRIINCQMGWNCILLASDREL
jgi:spermidine synthase